MPRHPSKGPGKGQGWGGPANGAGGGRREGAGRPTKAAAEVIAMKKAERLEAMKEHLIALALHAQREETQVTATLGYLKHEDAPTARVDVTSGGAPLVVERVIVDPQNRDPEGV